MKHMGVMLGVGVVVLGGIGAVFVMDRFPQDVPPRWIYSAEKWSMNWRHWRHHNVR